MFCLFYLYYFLEEVYYDSIDYILKNLRKFVVYVVKYKLFIIIWWIFFIYGNDIKRCKFGECYFIEVRKFKIYLRI